MVVVVVGRVVVVEVDDGCADSVLEEWFEESVLISAKKFCSGDIVVGFSTSAYGGSSNTLS